MMRRARQDRLGSRKKYVILGLLGILALVLAVFLIPWGRHDLLPHPETAISGENGTSSIPLDPSSPWPKFRANALQNGRATVSSRPDPQARPWTYTTGKGIFSSPVVDAEGTVYIGSADQVFYAIRRDGSLKWKFRTGEIVDSSALLDDRGRVYFGSGDQHVYCLDRDSGGEIWSFRAHSPEEVTKLFGVETHNVAWFEGNVGMLPDGSLLAPDDNCLVYAIDRDSGAAKTQYAGNEMIWSLPAVNARTGRIFFGTTYLAAKTVFAYDTATGKRRWTSGGLGSVAATPLLTSDRADGAVVVGGFDGYVRAYAQDTGRQLWAHGARDHIYASPAQLADGTIIQPSADGTVYALDPRTGRELWAFDTLEPIRSSPAVGGDGLIYVGSGEGRLFCIEPDGKLRWSFRCIDDDRNDLNASPALGRDGVYIAGESGGVFFVPYDYPLSDAGRADARCARGPGEDLPESGTFLMRTTRFGALEAATAAPDGLDANEPLTLSLMVRESGDTVLTALDRDSIDVDISGSPAVEVSVAANGRFLSIVPREYWTGSGGGDIAVRVRGRYTRDLARFGLKFFGGRRGGSFDQSFAFHVPPRGPSAAPLAAPDAPSSGQAAFEFSRLAAPNPTMLPSWNQIGFDSLHYLAGVVRTLPAGAAPGTGRYLVWVVGGKAGEGGAAVDPSLGTRYPLVLERDGDLLTFHNYDGFKISFVGSWDMPFGLFRIAAKVPGGGAGGAAGGAAEGGAASASFSAVALCDEIRFYGLGLKLMGMTEADTGRMTVAGGMKLAPWKGPQPVSVNAHFAVEAGSAKARLEGGTLAAKDHVYSLLLVDEATGDPLPLYYSRDTQVECDTTGAVTAVSVSFREGQVAGKVRAYLMVDTWPAASAVVEAPPARTGAAAFLSSPPELTTAVTDGLLGAFALVLGIRLVRKSRAAKVKGAASDPSLGLWGAMLCAMAVASLLGVPAHAIRDIAGMNPPNAAGQSDYWAFLGLALFAMTALAGTAALRDALGPERSKPASRVLWILSAFAWFAYAVAALTRLLEGYFVVFVAYSALVMAAVLVIYVILYARSREPGRLMTAAAILVGIAGSLVQASRALRFTLVWEFDYNSVYHAFMAMSAWLIYAGTLRSDGGRRG